MGFFFLFIVYWPVDTVTGFWFSVINDQKYQLPQAGEGGGKGCSLHTAAGHLILPAGQCEHGRNGCFPYENTVGQMI